MPNSLKKEFQILKVSEDEQKVFGIFYLTKMNEELFVDSDDEYIQTHEMEKAAYQFVLDSRVAGTNHKEVGVGRLIESFMVTKEKMALIEETLKSLGAKEPMMRPNAEFWFGGFQIDDENTWKMVKSKDFLSFSIGGIVGGDGE